ncbi:MAG: roadblock/LC7 domain-containing protein [Patescibacteria group bacterium]
MKTIPELLEEAVKKGLASIDGIEAKAVISRDGLLIWGDMPAGQNPYSFAAMISTVFGASENASIEACKGIPSRVIIESEIGEIFVVGAGPKALFVVLTASNQVGIFLLEMQKIAKEIKEILE